MFLDDLLLFQDSFFDFLRTWVFVINGHHFGNVGTQIYEPVIFHQIDLLARTNVNKGRDEETALF